MRRRLLVAVAVLVGLLAVAELVAVPVAERAVSAAVGRCVRHASLQITAVERPLVPRLLVGRARDVELRAEGVRIGELRVDEVELAVPEVTLPWAPGRPETLAARMRASVTERDATALARTLGPVPLPLRVRFADDRAELSAPGVPLTLSVEPRVEAEGTLTLVPRAGDTAWLERAGLELTLDPGDQVELTAVAVADGRLAGTADLRVVPGLSDGRGCEEPL